MRFAGTFAALALVALTGYLLGRLGREPAERLGPPRAGTRPAGPTRPGRPVAVPWSASPASPGRPVPVPRALPSARPVPSRRRVRPVALAGPADPAGPPVAVDLTCLPGRTGRQASVAPLLPAGATVARLDAAHRDRRAARRHYEALATEVARERRLAQYQARATGTDDFAGANVVSLASRATVAARRTHG
jgi:hypothetical protein